uniref:HEPN domain-containing protein n=1 Tax=Globodera pallida TaxID=36090 RepID=A0A183C415_GLOPA
MEEKKLKILNYEYGMTVDEKIADLTHKYEAYLGVLYLMRQRWQCAKIVEQFNEEHKRECQKFRKYLDILYEYLFRVYVKGRDVDPMLAQQLPAVKPIFKLPYPLVCLGSLSSHYEYGMTVDEKIADLTHKYEAYLGVLYLMRQRWQCAKIVEQFNEEHKRECQKFRKYLDILYEYLFRVYVKGRDVDPMLAQQLPAVKPIFKLQRAAAHDYNFLYRNSPFKRSIIARNDLDLLLALFHDPPTFYEILKMAKKLGEMDDDFYILLNSSDLKRIFKQSIEVNIGNFLEKKELCKEKQKENEIKKYLDGKDLYNGKTPKIDFNPINDLQQIVPEIAEEIEQMLQKSDWIYAN